MPIFIKENQELNKQTYKIPNDLQKHLKQTLSKYNGYTQNKGYKRLNSLVNPKYNKRSDKTDNFKDGKHITFSDMKRIDHDFRHMDKNPKNIERILNGGEEMASFVKNKLNQERTRVAPILKQKKIDTRNKNQVKPTVKPMKLPSINNVKVNIHENNDIYEHPYYDYLYDYNAYKVLSIFEDNGNLWIPLIQPSMYKKALNEFVKFGKLEKFPTKYIYQWMGIIMKNTAILHTCTDLFGHSTSYDFPLEDIIAFYFDEDEDEWENYKKNSNIDDDFECAFNLLEEKGFYDWCVLPDGTDAMSDFGLEPLEKLINEYDRNKTPEEVLVLINKILDVTHQRGDLSSIFINGGSEVLTKISENIKHKKIYIKEEHLNILKNLKE